MFVLLIQSACSVLLPGVGGGESGSIDVIVRTSSAAIFGHFLSANFSRRTMSGGTGQTGLQGQELLPSGTTGGPQARIGFQASEEGEQGTAVRTDPPTVLTERMQTREDRMQILTAAGIGLFSLLVLLLLRWLGPQEDGAATAAAAQLRDFVSGCVGFLIGYPAQKTEETQG